MAEKPAVRPDVAVGAALGAVARETLSEVRAVLDDAERSDAVAVHDVRKALKRWRALLRLLESFLGDDAPKDWDKAGPDPLNELRIVGVAHRYQMELVEPLWPKFGKVWVSEAQRLRDRLGAFQDLSVLLGFTVPHGALAPWRSRITPLILARQAKHAKAAQRLANRLLAERPKAFRRRLAALW